MTSPRTVDKVQLGSVYILIMEAQHRKMCRLNSLSPKIVVYVRDSRDSSRSIELSKHGV